MAKNGAKNLVNDNTRLSSFLPNLSATLGCVCVCVCVCVCGVCVCVCVCVCSTPAAEQLRD